MEPKKISFFLPNLFTALNMACGFVAILLAFEGKYYRACIFIGIGSIFDLFDGRVARWTGTQSSFGEQFDSLSDLISFGMAPAIIFYMKFLSGYERLGIVLAYLYLLCGALRLARFNVNIKEVSSDYFQGLPIPGGALALISYILISLHFPFFNDRYLSAIYIFIYSLFLISTIPFFSFKKSEFIQKNKKKIFLLIILAIALILTNEQVALFTFLNLYALISLVLFIKNRKNVVNELLDIDE